MSSRSEGITGSNNGYNSMGLGQTKKTDTALGLLILSTESGTTSIPGIGGEVQNEGGSKMSKSKRINPICHGLLRHDRFLGGGGSKCPDSI